VLDQTTVDMETTPTECSAIHNFRSRLHLLYCCAKTINLFANLKTNNDVGIRENTQELYLDSLAALGMSLNLSKTTNENISIL
jgi:hypothetical protein